MKTYSDAEIQEALGLLGSYGAELKVKRILQKPTEPDFYRDEFDCIHPCLEPWMEGEIERGVEWVACFKLSENLEDES